MDMINWKARRAGGRITVTGKNAVTGDDAKIVGVDYIEPGANGAYVRAVDKNNVLHILFVGPNTDGIER